MILFEVHSLGKRRVPFERYAPRPIDVNAVTDGPYVQLMQLKPGQIQVAQTVGRIQRVHHVRASLR
jgi:hypothetical protein